VLVIGAFIVLFPLAWRLASPFATSAYNPAVDARVLLLWPDRIELRPINELPNFSPRPPEAKYSFLIPPGRAAWVAEQLKAYATPSSETVWQISVTNLEPGRQEVGLELFGDGFQGVVYEASKEKIVPLKTRLAGPGFAFIVIGIDLVGTALVALIAFLLRKRLHGIPLVKRP
jgi:hypothetical protein